MINEERLCMACHLPIEDMRKATMVPDEGTNQVYHRACLEVMVGETPTPDEPIASGVMLGQKPLIHIGGAVGYEDGKPIYAHELRKADHPEYGTSQCILCHRAISGDVGIVRSQNHVAHAECVQTLLAFVNQPEAPTVPTPAVKAIPASVAEYTREDKRKAVEAAILIAEALKTSE